MSNPLIPDVLSYIQNKTQLTRETICRILIESGRIDDVYVNPQQFMDKVCSEINAVLNEMIVDGVKYEKITDEPERKKRENGNPRDFRVMQQFTCETSARQWERRMLAHGYEQDTSGKGWKYGYTFSISIRS